MQTLQNHSLRVSPLEPLSHPKRSPFQTLTNIRRAPRKAHSPSISASAASAPKRETDPKKRVVITGMGLVSVFGNDVDAYYDRLLAGESGVGPIDRFDVSKFPTRFAGQIRGFTSDGYIDGKNDRRLDDCLRYCLVSGKKALESAGLGGDHIKKIDKERTGVLVGTGMGGLTVFSDGVQSLIERGYRKITPFFIPYAITNMGSALLAIELGFMGPNYSISTACATSNYCFYAAANHIRRGEADLMLAGGSEAAIIPIGLGRLFLYLIFYNFLILPIHCLTFSNLSYLAFPISPKHYIKIPTYTKLTDKIQCLQGQLSTPMNSFQSQNLSQNQNFNNNSLNSSIFLKTHFPFRPIGYYTP